MCHCIIGVCACVMGCAHEKLLWKSEVENRSLGVEVRGHGNP